MKYRQFTVDSEFLPDTCVRYKAHANGVGRGDRVDRYMPAGANIREFCRWRGEGTADLDGVNTHAAYVGLRSWD